MNDPELLNKVYMFLIQNFRDKFLNASTHEIRSLIKENLDMNASRKLTQL